MRSVTGTEMNFELCWRSPATATGNPLVALMQQVDQRGVRILPPLLFCYKGMGQAQVLALLPPSPHLTQVMSLLSLTPCLPPTSDLPYTDHASVEPANLSRVVSWRAFL